MEKPVAVMELTSRSVKLVVGYVLDNQVYVLYALEKPIGNLIDRGTIADRESLIKEVQSLSSVSDASARLKIKISEAVLGLPPLGLEIFQTKQVMTVLNEEGKIADIDIRNIRNLIAKERIPVNNTLIDVIPDQFVLDQGRTFINVPIGETSNTITVLAKVHTLPARLVDSYCDILASSGIAVKRTMVNTFGTVTVLADYPEVPADYILVDMGAKITSVSLVGKRQLYGSSYFPWGGNDITEHIAESFNINTADAEKYKCLYGLDRREMNFEAPVCTSEDENGKPIKHRVAEMNEIIKSELDGFVQKLTGAVEVLLEGYDSSYKKLPMIVVGGASQLYGLSEYLAHKVDAESFTPIAPRTLGCRNPGFFNCLGLIKAGSIYQSSFSDSHARIASVTREGK